VRELRLTHQASFDYESGKSLGAQMKHADKFGATLAVILGEDELAADEVTVKDLQTGAQERVARADLAAHLLRRLTTQETAR
jgi:histidyl-tRNA synthetase